MRYLLVCGLDAELVDIEPNSTGCVVKTENNYDQPRQKSVEKGTKQEVFNLIKSKFEQKNGDGYVKEIAIPNAVENSLDACIDYCDITVKIFEESNHPEKAFEAIDNNITPIRKDNAFQQIYSAKYREEIKNILCEKVGMKSGEGVCWLFLVPPEKANSGFQELN